MGLHEYEDIISDGVSDQLDLAEIEELSPSIVKKLNSEGFETVEDVLEGGFEELIEISGIGEKTAKKILETLNNMSRE